MRKLRSRTNIKKTQKRGEMRNTRSTGELAGRLSKASEGSRRHMKSREVQSTAGVRRMMQVPKTVRDREGKGGCWELMKVQEKRKIRNVSGST